jgi:hypothetical protein
MIPTAMIYKLRKPLVAALALASISISLGAGELTPTFAERGKLVVDESFDGAKLGKGWAAAKGDWQIKEGVLTGAEKQADKHAAVLNFQRPNTDSIISIRFKLEGIETFNLSFNHAKGHLFRVIVGPDRLVLQKNKNKKDPKSKPIRMATAEGVFKKGCWFRLLVEVKGDKVVAQTSNNLRVSGSHSDFATKKPNYRFVMKGQHLLIDDLKIWEVAD